MIQKKALLVPSAFIVAAFYLIAITTFTGSVAFATPATSEKISLSIGNVLGSVNLDVTAMVLSKDKKIAFTTVSSYGTLKILDISNENYPSVIGSLALKFTGPIFKIKSLALSSDEKTLYVSNSRDVEIIDVSNLEAPVLLSFTKSTIFDDSYFTKTVPSFKTSLVVEETTQTLYIGGLGMQVYDVLNPQRPALLNASANSYGYDSQDQINEICLLKEKKIILRASRKLEGFDVSNPRDIRTLFTLETTSSVIHSVVRSLLLSDDSKTVYLLGNDIFENNKLRLTEVDISDSKSPKLVNEYDLGTYITKSYGFLTISPNKTKFYIYYDDGKKYSLLTFDTIQKISSLNENTPTSLVNNVYAMTFANDGKTLIAASNDQFAIIELRKDYPNSQYLETVFPINAFELASSYQNFMQVTAEGVMFVLRSVTQDARLYSVLDIYEGERLAGSFQSDQAIIQMFATNNYKTVYLLGRQTLTVVDVTNRGNLALNRKYAMKNSNIIFSRFLLSEDGKTCFMATREGDNSGDAKITLFHFTDSSYIEPLSTIDKIFSAQTVNMVRYRTDGLIVVDKEINIYNISNINTPLLVSSLPIGDREIPPYVNSVLVSRDNTTLYLDTYDNNLFTSFRIYDLTNLKSPSLLSDFALPKLDPQGLRPPFFLSRDQQSAFIFTDNSLLKLSLSNLNSPVAVGTIPLSSNKTERINSLVSSEDGQYLFAVTDKKQITIYLFTSAISLFLKQEKFSLGQKYSDTISLLANARTASDFDLMDPKKYKIIKLSLVDIKIAPNSLALKSTTIPLPSWITFDKQTNSLTVEPKNQAALGSHVLQASIAMKFSTKAFSKIDGVSDSSEDILACLISLGYIDPHLFLTNFFGSYDDFLLPSKYSAPASKTQIYNILLKNYVEASTGFSVVPSLSVEHNQGGPIAISTLSTNDILLDIKLYPYSGDSQVRFLSKQYDLVLTALSEEKSRIILEGPLVDVNTALKSIIVDLSGNSAATYDAFISVTDGLNPAYSTYIASANKYFLQNKAPIQNPSKSSLQEQVEKISIATGQYFNIQLDSETFIDSNGNDLTYHFEMSDKTAEIPSWIVFEKLTLHGTAPEDLTGRTLKMVLVVNNEFREVKVPFTLNVKLTTTTMVKLIAKVAFILMMVVLAISTIRSCGGKKNNEEEERLPRDSREYLLRNNHQNDYY